MSCWNSPKQQDTPQQNEQGQSIISKNVDVADFTQLVDKDNGQFLDVRTPEG